MEHLAFPENIAITRSYKHVPSYVSDNIGTVVYKLLRFQFRYET